MAPIKSDVAIGLRMNIRDTFINTVGAVYKGVNELGNLEFRKIYPLPLGEGRVRVSGFAWTSILGFALSGLRFARPSPAASRRPLPEGEGPERNLFTAS